jgi:hypothetical protein
MMADDRLFWLAIYRAIMAIAAAIKRFKIEACADVDRDDTIPVVIEPENRGIDDGKIR